MVEEKLQQMYDLAKSWDEPSLVPNTVSFNAVLSAWAQSGDRAAPHRSEKVLTRMQALYEQGQADCQPNVASFNTVLNCWEKWANSTMREAPERAEAILHHMHHLFDAGNMGVKPNVVSYSAVMHAWARSRHPDAAFRAQALFDELQKRYQAGDQDMKPDLFSFRSLIKAWGRSKHKDGGANVQNVFNDMLARYKSGETDLKPNAAFVNALFAALGRTGGPERAEQILRAMASSELGETMPIMNSYNAVMNVWSLSSKPNAVHQVQALFDELMQKYEAGDSGMKPDPQVFATLITAWGRSKHVDSAAKAQAVFDYLLSLYALGHHEDLKPNVVVYNALIGAWTKAGVPEKAEQILREMESEESLGIKPNAKTYHVVISGWSRSCHPKSADRMKGLYDKMKDKYLAGDDTVKPDINTFGLLLSAWRRTGRKDGLIKAEVVFRDMQDRFVSGEAGLKPLVDEFGSLFNKHPINPRFANSETGRFVAVISTENLLLNHYRQMYAGTGALLQIDTSYRLSIERWGLMPVKTAAPNQQGHTVAYAFVSSEDSDAHCFVLDAIRKAVVDVVNARVQAGHTHV
jgi:pentatricopeptide repeat protein